MTGYLPLNTYKITSTHLIINWNGLMTFLDVLEGPAKTAKFEYLQYFSPFEEIFKGLLGQSKSCKI